MVSPVLTPLSLDASHPFPFISNLSTSWEFRLAEPTSGESVLVRVRVPHELPQWLEVGTGTSSEGRVFVRLDEIIAANAEKLFPGMVIEAASLIRVCRDAEVELDDDGLDKRAFVEEEVRQRRFEPVVCLEVQPNADPASVAALREHFGLEPDDVYELRELLDYTTLFEIASLDLDDLHDPPWTPLAPPSLAAHADIFEAIRSEDILLHHPYDSFDASVERFIREAADDPLTVSIKMTVYRVGDDTPFVQSLIRAAQAGKQVACAIELSARFDEERNLHWARELETVGAHVVYGVTGLKTHSKTALVVRREQGGIRCYAHVATGNYHTRTARLYEDLGLLTADPAVIRDVVTLFHFLTGRSRTPSFQTLLVAPLQMRSEFVRLVENEIEHAATGRPARIVCKLNQLEDPGMCALLLRASQAGVPDRPRRARLLLPGARRPRRDRQHPDPLGDRALPRALADLLLRGRVGRSRRRRVPHRLGRLDAPESLRTRGGGRAHPRSTPPRTALGHPRDEPRRPAQCLADAGRRDLRAARSRDRRRRRLTGYARDDDAPRAFARHGV